MLLRRLSVIGPWRLSGRGGMFLPLVHQGPSHLRRIRPRLACSKAPTTNVNLGLKAAARRTHERAHRAGVMQAYALLAAVRGALGAGVSRA